MQSLKNRRDFKKIYRYGATFIGIHVLIRYLKLDLDQPKLGITVTKKYGKAHIRNRFKRITRAAGRDITLPPLAYNISPRGPARPLKTQDIASDLEKLKSDLVK